MNASARACMHTFSRKEGEVGWNRARTFVALLERRSGSDSLRGRGKVGGRSRVRRGFVQW